MTNPPTLAFPFEVETKRTKRRGRRVLGLLIGVLVFCGVLAANVPTLGGPVRPRFLGQRVELPVDIGGGELEPAAGA